ncbi:MAG TPA: arabinan endo-1,5-alpha-L-arabinosidase [Candidatus Acidoferrum sp.]|nr:arabinan endo-1,5-alpha-L-arabinosidase [Candidatus Acidoferrum sp.]
MIKKPSNRARSFAVGIVLTLCLRPALLPARAQGPPGPPPAAHSAAPSPLAPFVIKNVTVHDPSTIVKCKDEFWVFYTGGGVPSYHSKDLVNWERGPAVFTNAPPWVAENVPANQRMNYWAPDVARVGDKYFLYYSASSFGKNTSGIGLAVNATLDPADPAYRWTDEGLVIKSGPQDDFNTIDPAIFHDTNGSLWLSFGSFWSGIRMIELDRDSGKRITPDYPVLSLAHYDSIEASYLYQRGGYYYLFVDWGMCCRGSNSTYNIRLGRSRQINGPYLDKDGTNLLDGGGSLFLDTTGPLVGPGHAGIIVDNGTNWFSCHFEADGTRRRGSVLAIIPLRWNAGGWPELDTNGAPR